MYNKCLKEGIFMTDLERKTYTEFFNFIGRRQGNAWIKPCCIKYNKCGRKVNPVFNKGTEIYP